MSSNLRLETRSCSFPLSQTPSDVTEQILKSPDPKAAYVAWDEERCCGHRKSPCQDHKYKRQNLDAYLVDHPTARWSGR